MALTLVTGATGTAGSQVVRQLSSRGVRVRAFVRDRRKAESVLGPDVELALGDLRSPDTIAAAMRGVEKVLLVVPGDPRQAEWETSVAEAARRAGVGHILKLSALNASPDSPVDDLRWHWAGERALAEAGVPFTVIRCNFFAQFFLIFAATIRSESAFHAPVRAGKVSPVDARDIAAVAAAVLTGEGHAGRVYELTGPEALSYPEVAERLSAAVGRKIAYAPVPPEVSWQDMLAGGRPEWDARILLQLYEEIDAGKFGRVTMAVEQIASRKPTSFDQFARDYREAFA